MSKCPARARYDCQGCLVASLTPPPLLSATPLVGRSGVAIVTAGCASGFGVSAPCVAVALLPAVERAAGDAHAAETDEVLPPHWIQDSTPPPPFGKGVHVDLGIFGTTYLWDVLHKHGADSVGIDLLTETSYPSFGLMIEQGATTLWEVRRLLDHADLLIGSVRSVEL